MKKLLNQLKNTMFDVASGGMLLAVLGIPALIIIAVVILVWVAAKLIMKADEKNHMDNSNGSDK